MSSGTKWHKEYAASQFAPLLALARTVWAFAPAAADPGAIWRCATCNQDTHAPSVRDPARCLRCAPPLARPNPYAWRDTPFGRIRKVAPLVAARWNP